MATNAELEVQVRKLTARVSELEEEITGKQTPLPETVEDEPEPVEAAPTAYEIAVAEHEAMVKPFLDEWQAKVDAEFEKRVQEYWENAGVRPTISKEDFIRAHVERDIKYDGPAADYDDWVASQRVKYALGAPERDRLKRNEGLPPNVFRDPTGLLRTGQGGELYKQKLESKEAINDGK